MTAMYFYTCGRPPPAPAPAFSPPPIDSPWIHQVGLSCRLQRFLCTPDFFFKAAAQKHLEMCLTMLADDESFSFGLSEKILNHM